MLTEEKPRRHQSATHMNTRQTIKQANVNHKLNVTTVCLELLFETIDENEGRTRRSPVHGVRPVGVRGRRGVVEDHLAELNDGEIANCVKTGVERLRGEVTLTYVLSGW